MCKCSLFSTSLPTFVACRDFDNILIGVRWCLMALNCVFVIISNLEHLFMCLCTCQGLTCRLQVSTALPRPTQGRVFSSVVAFPDLVQHCANEVDRVGAFLNPGLGIPVLVRVEPSGLLSEVRAAFMILFEQVPTMAAAIPADLSLGPLCLPD